MKFGLQKKDETGLAQTPLYEEVPVSNWFSKKQVGVQTSGIALIVIEHIWINSKFCSKMVKLLPGRVKNQVR